MHKNFLLIVISTLKILTITETRADVKTNLIIDTDAGADDALALLLALAVSDKVRILAITCTYGNTWLENVEKNVLKTLTIANRSDIPVYSGAEGPLIRNYNATDYFGIDGFGDFNFTLDNQISIDRSKHAAIAMIDLVKQYPGEISIVTIGPTTNVALAVTLDPTFSTNVKRIYIMGSKPYGSINPEFNFSMDPESNLILLNSKTRLPKLITTGNIAADYKISKSWRMHVFGKIRNKLIEFLNNVESAVLKRLNEWEAVDSITLATIIWPELIIESVEAHMISYTCSEKAGDVNLLDDDQINVEIVRTFDIEAFKSKLLTIFRLNVANRSINND